MVSRISWNPPETTPTRAAALVHGGDQLAYARRRLDARENVRESRTGTPASARTRERRLVAKSTSPRIAASVAAATSAPRPDLVGDAAR